MDSKLLGIYILNQAESLNRIARGTFGHHIPLDIITSKMLHLQTPRLHTHVCQAMTDPSRGYHQVVWWRC